MKPDLIKPIILGLLTGFIFVIPYGISILDSRNCYNCIAIMDIQTQTGEMLERPVVGDYFTWKMTIINFGANQVTKNVTVYVFSPTNKQIGNTITCRLNLKPQEGSPCYALPASKDDDYSIYEMNSVGTYTILIESDDLLFYSLYSPEGKKLHRKDLNTSQEMMISRYAAYPNKYEYVFDVMPRWEYDWEIELRNSQIALKNLQTNSSADLAEMKGFVKHTDDLTFAIAILTLVNVTLFSIDLYRKHFKK